VTAVVAGRPEYAFVSGMKKSGTNWVSKLIGTHPDVSVWGELHLELVAEDARAFLDAQRREHLHDAGLGTRDAFPMMVDHTPGWLALHLGESARYVHIIRDVRDVIVADAFHSMRLNEYPPEVHADQRSHIEAWRSDPWYFRAHPDALVHPAELDRLARTWVDIVRSARELAGRCPEIVRLVRYEDLHADVLGGRRSLFALLGLDVERADDLGPDLLPAFGGRGEDPHAFNRKGIVGDHATYLSTAAMAEIDHIAGPTLEELGYS